MKVAALTLILATAASAAVREPEITMTARRIMNSLQINAVVAKGYKFPPGHINLIQVGTAIPERPISMNSREICWMIQPIPKTWTIGIAMTDKNRTKVWQSFYKGTLNANSENAIVEVVDEGPVIPESGIVQRPPVLPPLSDVKDADRLPDAVKSAHGGKWRNRSGVTAGPAFTDSPFGNAMGGRGGGKQPEIQEVNVHPQAKPGAAPSTDAPAQGEKAPAATPSPAASVAAPVAVTPVKVAPVANPVRNEGRSEGAKRLIDQLRNRK